MYKKEKIDLLVINPMGGVIHGPRSDYVSPGLRLSERIARAAGGRLIKVERSAESHRFTPDEMAAVLDGIETAFQAGKGPSLAQPINR